MGVSGGDLRVSEAYVGNFFGWLWLIRSAFIAWTFSVLKMYSNLNFCGIYQCPFRPKNVLYFWGHQIRNFNGLRLDLDHRCVLHFYNLSDLVGSWSPVSRRETYLRLVGGYDTPRVEWLLLFQLTVPSLNAIVLWWKFLQAFCVFIWFSEFSVCKRTLFIWLSQISFFSS